MMEIVRAAAEGLAVAMQPALPLRGGENSMCGTR
jgi:hypothetical protein